MPKYNKAINAFSSGELGPKTFGRFDIDEYKQGVESMLNMVPYKSGGVVRRPGSRFAAEISSGLLGATISPVGMYPFIYSQTEAYNVVITPNGNTPDTDIKIFRRDGSLVTLVYTITGTNYFQLPNMSSDLDRSGFQFAQSADVLYFTHVSGTYPPFVIKRLAEDSFEVQHIWGLGEIYQPTLTTVYKTANTDVDKLIYCSAASTVGPFLIQKTALEVRTLYSVDAAGVAIDTIFDPSHEGSIWRISESASAKESVIYITTVAANKQSAYGYVMIGIDAGSVGVAKRTDNWNAPEWSDLDGWPRSLTFFQQRLVFGGNISSPDTMWMSQIGDYKVFMGDRLDQDITADVSGLQSFGVLTDSDSFNATIASTEVNDILWLSSDTVMVCGTIGGEYTISPIDGLFGISNISINTRSSYGSKPVQAFRGGEGVVHISRDGKRVRRFRYSIETGEQSNLDLTTLNSDVVYHNPDTVGTVSTTEFKSITVTQMAWQESRSTMWFVTSNKALIGFTIDKVSGVAGWHRHSFATGGSGGTTAEVLAVTVLPNEDNTYLDVWIAVSRVIGARQLIALEKLADDFEHTILSNESTDENDHPFYMDSSVRYSATLASETRTFTPPTTINLTDDSITFQGPHKYHQGQAVTLTSTGTLPAGLALATTYYLIVESDITLYFAASLADANTGKSTAINLTGYGSGIHSVVPVAITTLSTWSGFNHLLGQNVTTLQDGIIATEIIGLGVSIASTGIGEKITTDPIAEIIVGLPYTSRIKTLPLETGGVNGSVSRGIITRINRVNLMFYKTWAAEFGIDVLDLEDSGIDYTVDGAFSGDKPLDLTASPDRLAQVIVETDTPLPMALLGMTLRGQDNEG